MILKDFIVVHLVHTITGCNNNIRLMTTLKESDVLCDRISGSAIPVAVLRCSGRGEYI